MDAGVHLPQIDLSGAGLSLQRLTETAAAARELGFAAVSVNDHFLFSRPWLDGPTAIAAVLPHTGDLELVTSIALPTLRGPIPLAKTLAALDVLSGGRLVAGVGAGSSRADYDAVGVRFEERWQRLDEAAAVLKAALQGGPMPAPDRYYAVPEDRLLPLPTRDGGIPLWLASWGSTAGLRRVARLGDGWLASAYHTDPVRFAAGWALLQSELERRGRPQAGFPHALVTMWTWVTESRTQARQVMDEVLAPMLRRDPELLEDQLCVGPAQRCAELLTQYAEAGCRRVHFWPVGEERRQLRLIAEEVLPRLPRIQGQRGDDTRT